MHFWHADIGWMAGAIYNDAERQKFKDDERKQLSIWEDDPDLPVCFV